MSKIKYLDLIFENCEVYRLNSDMFNDINIRGIKENREYNTIVTKSCEEFSLRINRRGLNLKGDYQGLELYDRLNVGNDITGVALIYEDKREELIYTPWAGEDDYINECQQIHELGDEVLLLISEKEYELEHNYNICKCENYNTKTTEEKTADEMFEELGYTKKEYGYQIWYYEINGLYEESGFEFNKKAEDVYPHCIAEEGDMAIYINMDMLKAINKKCEELGWL